MCCTVEAGVCKRANGRRAVQYLLVKKGLNVEGLHDICVELGEQEGVPDALVQQLPHLRDKQQL